MKIIHLCYWEKSGGASIAANRLHKAFMKRGYKSNMLVVDTLTTEENVHSIRNKKTSFFCNIYQRLSSFLLRKYRPFLGNFSINLWGHNLSDHPMIKEADVIYIHWVNNSMYSLSGINELLRTGKKVFWFLHDMYLLTGGCHHSFDCNKYMSHCFACSLLNSKKNQDICYYQFKAKKKLLSNHLNLKLIAPSNWIYNCASESALFRNHSVSLIPNSVSTSDFKYIPKVEARTQLSLPLHKKLIAFGADMGESNPYKGWQFLERALSELSEKDKYMLITFGGINRSYSTINGIDVRSFGRISSVAEFSYIYSAVDVFVIPSLAESFGQTAIEAMSCGTPVVGFNVGGIPDIIRHRYNGYLANYQDVIDLKIGIEWCISNISEDTRKIIRQYVIETFDSSVVINKHIELINK